MKRGGELGRDFHIVSAKGPESKFFRGKEKGNVRSARREEEELLIGFSLSLKKPSIRPLGLGEKGGGKAIGGGEEPVSSGGGRTISGLKLFKGAELAQLIAEKPRGKTNIGGRKRKLVIKKRKEEDRVSPSLSKKKDGIRVGKKKG